jgi:hypothetical protein
VDSDATRGSNTGSRRLARVVLLLGRGSGVQIHGRRVFAFGAFDVLLNPRSTNENDEPNEQMCQLGPELVWRGSFYSRIKGLHARTLRNVVDFFLAGEKQKNILPIASRRAASSAKNKRRPFLSLPEKDEQRRRNRILGESVAIITTIIFSERVLEPE